MVYGATKCRMCVWYGHTQTIRLFWIVCLICMRYLIESHIQDNFRLQGLLSIASVKCQIWKNIVNVTGIIKIANIISVGTVICGI